MTAAFIFVVALPVLMAVAMLSAPGREFAVRGAWLAPLPALLLALWPAPPEPHRLDWLLLGGFAGLDAIGRVFLLFTALLWSAAGAYARHYSQGDVLRLRFFAFFLVTLSGNLGLIVAQDLASFYAAFAVMTFAGYGLVVHSGSAEAARAGRVYLVMAVVGETMLLAAFLTVGTTAASLALSDVARAVADSPNRNLVVALLLGGFGIKAGALPLHVWLPLAHPVAPTPASAVLSGSMIKAGILGWLRFLPFGLVSLEGWGALLVSLGLAAAFFGVIVGVTQRDPKTALAYSSISQMGLINVAIGIGLSSVDAWPLALAACLTYVVHHGLAKGALFLGVGIVHEARGRVERRLAAIGMVFAALAVAGAPLTSGGVAKDYLKVIAPLSPVRWPLELDLILGFAALGTTLLMARTLQLAHRMLPAEDSESRPSSLWRSWVALLAGVATAVWIAPAHYDLDVYPPTIPTAEGILVAIWPIIGGVLIVWVVLLLRRHGRLDPDRHHITPGDLLVPAERLLGAARARLGPAEMPEPPRPVVSVASMWYGIYASREGLNRLREVEVRLTSRDVVSVLIFLLAIAVGLALVLRP